MWSHTIPTSKPKVPTTRTDRPTRPARPTAASKKSTSNAAEEMLPNDSGDDSTRPSSRAQISKKPLTVAKAPTLGRTTSSKADPTTPKDGARPGLETRGSRATLAQQVKTSTPARVGRQETPGQVTPSAARTRPPVVSARTKTPTQATPAARGGTPVSRRPVVTSPKSGINAKRPRPKSSTIAKEDGEQNNPNVDDDTGAASESASHADTIESDLPIEPSTPSSHLQEIHDLHHLEEPLGHVDRASPKLASGKKPGKRSGDSEYEAHEELNREIIVRNDIINSLKQDLQELNLAYERKLEEAESASTRGEDLQSELESVRNTVVDLDDAHRSTVEKHDSLLRSRDKIIQNLSQEAEDLRRKYEGDEHGKDSSVRDREEKPQIDHQRQESGGQTEILASKDAEIQSLSEVVQDLRKQLEAADIARAKEIYDELLRSKDKEIASVSGVVQDLRGELKANDKPKKQRNQDQLLQSKEEEIKALSGTVKDLQERLEANEKANEQKVNHSVSSLRGEFQELQNKHKRKIEDLEAAATARVEKLQSEYDELLQSRDQEIRDIAGATQDLQKEIETAENNQKRELEDAKTNHEQQLREVKAALEGEVATEIQEMVKKHKHDLDSARTEQQTADTNHQQELREARRKHENAMENIRGEIEARFQDNIARLERELAEVNTKHDQAIEEIESKSRVEIDTIVKDREAGFRDMALTHERELEEASAQYQKELADVERLRGEGSDEISQKHEDQLKVIAEKYQKELQQLGQEKESLVSDYVLQLEKAKIKYEKIKSQAGRYLQEKEQSKNLLELRVEWEKHMGKTNLQKLSAAHTKEIETANHEHQETINQATSKHEELNDLVEKERRERQELVRLMGLETEQARSKSTSTTAEIESLKATLEKLQLELSQSKADEDAKLKYQQELRDVRSKHDHDIGELRNSLEKSIVETMSLKDALDESENLRTKADQTSTSKHEQTLQDLSRQHKQALSRLRSEHDSTLAEMAVAHSDLQRDSHQLSTDLATTQRSLNNALSQNIELVESVENARREKAEDDRRITGLMNDVEELESELGTAGRDKERLREEAAIESALQRDNKDLALREQRKLTETVAKLQKDIETLRSQLTDSCEDLERTRTEAHVGITLLKDRLELADLQKQSASEDTSLAQNEANVEIALLKDKLELSDLQSQQDKKAMSALEEQLRRSQTQPLDTKPFVHHQLREELAMLARHHAANLADVEALKASILAEREVREEEWRKRAQRRELLSKEMQGMRAELNGITGVH